MFYDKSLLLLRFGWPLFLGAVLGLGSVVFEIRRIVTALAREKADRIPAGCPAMPGPTAPILGIQSSRDAGRPAILLDVAANGAFSRVVVVSPDRAPFASSRRVRVLARPGAPDSPIEASPKGDTILCSGGLERAGIRLCCILDRREFPPE